MNLILLIAAVIISWLIFTWLLKVVKTTVKTALLIAAIALILQLTVGIGPEQIWQQIQALPALLQELLPGASPNGEGG